MNQVFLTGVVADPVVQLGEQGNVVHVQFPLCVSHKTREGMVKREIYTVNAWNGVATWAKERLTQGQRIMVKGYLTQFIRKQPELAQVTEVQVTAEAFFADRVGT